MKNFNWENYLSDATLKHYPPDRFIYCQGDQKKGFYYLASGKVNISVIREDGYERIIDIVYAGNLFGEQLLNNNLSLTTATALSSADIYYFSKEQYLTLALKDSAVSAAFSLSLIEKLRLMAHINMVLDLPFENQLAHFIYMLYHKNEHQSFVLSQALLTRYVGISRVTLWKILKIWGELKIITISKQQITINDLDAIRALLK